MGLKTFPGGVHSHDNKEYSRGAAIEEMPLPGKVYVHLSQHIGAPAKAIVKVGDEVLTGQKIAEAGGFVSIPMHAPISGKVTKIGEFPHPAGTTGTAIEITGDGEDRWVELKEDETYNCQDVDEMKKRIAEAGISGMGGAGFPTHVKLTPPKDKPIDTVILNGVECEPYLNADYRLMLERSDEIIEGMKLIMKIVDAKKGIIGIEANKPDCIKLLREKTANEPNLRVDALKLKYPQGAEKQLIYACTKRKVPNKGGLPMSVGVVVQNIGTALAVYEAIRWQKPLIERVITVSGKIVNNPKNIKARIGTLYSELLEYCGGTKEEVSKIISGGPMMGFAISNLETPMIKGSSGLLLFNKKEAAKKEEQTCIRCGLCVEVCPMNLVPSLIVKNAKYKDWEQVEKLGVMDCMKCGSCAFICPAQIKLIQWIDIGKLEVGKRMRARRDMSKA